LLTLEQPKTVQRAPSQPPFTLPDPMFSRPGVKSSLGNPEFQDSELSLRKYRLTNARITARTQVNVESYTLDRQEGFISRTRLTHNSNT